MTPERDSRTRVVTGAQRVLVVDDHPDTAHAICAIIEVLGHHCRTASTGRFAIAEAYGFDPTIIILDLSLPDLSGYEVARVLRQRPGRRQPHIAALSGWGSREKRDAALAAGCDQYVLKPADAEKIRGILLAADLNFSTSATFGDA